VPQASIPDVAQETFLATFRGIHRFDPRREDATFRGWLWTVTRSRIQDYFRRTRGADRGVGGSTANVRLSEIADQVPLDEPSESTDVVRLLRRAMSRVEAEFEPRTWQVFQDLVIAGRDTQCVAGHYGISPAAVRQVKSRVLRRLRLELGDA
jgi:RNA polymerase sigma-70 factor (ECF subfamily)